MACFGMLLDGRAQATGIRKSSNDATLLLVINGHTDLVEFTLPECYGGMHWSLLVDTTSYDGPQFIPETAHQIASRYFFLGSSIASGVAFWKPQYGKVAV